MLKYFRKSSGGLVSVVIIGAIALVFIFWGIGGQDSGTTEDIKLDGQSVSLGYYMEILSNVNERARQQKQGALTDAEEILARRQALGLLVERQNLLSLGRATGRSASVEAINRAVKSNPAFQVEGRFDMKVYEQTAPQIYNSSLVGFEARLADDLLLGEVASFIQSLSFVPEALVRDEFHFTEDRLVLDYAYFPDSAFPAGEEPSEDQIAAFYQDNRENWRSPAQASVEYVEVDVGAFADQVEVTDEDLEDAFLDERDSLSRPEEAQVSHILFRFPSLSPTPEEKSEARLKAEAALERARTEDFKALASELSEDNATAARGGSLGPIGRGQTLAPFEEAVFGPGKDQIGQVLGPIETLFGYHLLMVDGYQEAHQPTLEEAREELSSLVAGRKAKRLAVNRIEDLIDIMPTRNLDAQVFAETARSIGLEPKESPLFSDASGAPSFLAEEPGLVDAAIRTPLGQLGDPVDNAEHVVLYTPKEKLDSFLRPLEDEAVRPEVVEAWKASLAQRGAQEAAQAFLASSQSSGWDTGALPEEVERGQTEPFARMQFYAAGAFLAEAEPVSLLSEYFKLGKRGDLTGRPIRIEGGQNRGYLVLLLSDLQPADEAALAESDLANRQQTAKAALAESGYAFWNASQSAKAKIQLPQYLQDMLIGRDLADPVQMEP
ncbi:MAG: SurA N-terminal domain-containing protein [Deltaproteobacteria bacterium]|jgi:peptidyl-prolyl cis-trans isomerase D|nr:SurA N-terminal domain-containing protein [Deltaproteobacteria bacterium]